MQRLGAVFIAVCMVAIATSAGAILHYNFGLSIPEASPISFGILLTLLLVHYQISRVRDRMMIDEQMDDLTRLKLGLTKELQDVREIAKQLDDDVAMRVQQEMEPILSELDVIGTLVKQLAESCAELDERVQTGEVQVEDVREQLASATHSVMELEQMLRANARALANKSMRPESAPRVEAPAQAPAPAPVPDPILEQRWSTEPASYDQAAYQEQQDTDRQHRGPDAQSAAPARTAVEGHARPDERRPRISEEDEAAVRKALALGQIELFMQPVVTLPMRKPQYYEALTRLKTEDGGFITPDIFLPVCSEGNFMPMLDRMAMNEAFRLLRRLTDRGRAVDIFCNLSIESLGDSDFFALMRDLFEQNRDLAEHVILEFRQADLRSFGILEDETLQLLRSMGFRFSVDQITNLGTDFDAFARKGIRFAKVAAPILLNKDAGRGLDIHPADFSRVLARKGIELIVTHIATESLLVSLVEFNVHLAQGDHFAPAKALKGAGSTGQGGGSSGATSGASGADQIGFNPPASPLRSESREAPSRQPVQTRQPAQARPADTSGMGQPPRAVNGEGSSSRNLGDNPRIAKALRALASEDGEDSDTRNQFRAVLAEAAGLMDNPEARANARVAEAQQAPRGIARAPEVTTHFSDRLPATEDFGLKTGNDRGQFIDLSEPAPAAREAGRPRRSSSAEQASSDPARFERLIR